MPGSVNTVVLDIGASRPAKLLVHFRSLWEVLGLSCVVKWVPKVVECSKVVPSCLWVFIFKDLGRFGIPHWDAFLAGLEECLVPKLSK